MASAANRLRFTEHRSAHAVYQIIYITVSLVLESRNVLKKELFEPLKWQDGSTVKVLKRVQNDDDSEQITEWLAGARDSLMKKYLDKFIYALKSKETGELLETYAFNIKYNNGVSLEVEMNESTTNEMTINNYTSFRAALKKVFDKVLRLIEMSSDIQGAITTECHLRYNERTPINYSPNASFNDYNGNSHLYFPGDKRSSQYNQVSSPYHSVIVSTQTAYFFRDVSDNYRNEIITDNNFNNAAVEDSDEDMDMNANAINEDNKEYISKYYCRVNKHEYKKGEIIVYRENTLRTIYKIIKDKHGYFCEIQNVYNGNITEAGFDVIKPFPLFTNGWKQRKLSKKRRQRTVNTHVSPALIRPRKKRKTMNESFKTMPNQISLIDGI